ncbi:serine/threonine-protein kinase [Microbulbifer sediminum]|uniref:serine/threonine-protein kinase n=1 Tax=Microbulbifer sediminum TaxID=2904250 RepID=UPI001F002A30|nr:serine/threonine-protein kinase [Microbulbifer sediminum]
MEIAEPPQSLLGRYRVERALGAGGMGVVYLARDTQLQRPVAIKQLRADATTESAGARIRSEARLLAQLNHPNIVQLYDVIERDGDIALVMEYVEGTTLKEWMRERTPTLREKLDLLMQICRGLSEAHSLGIVHRDLKPDNILLAIGTGGVTAKITDFGIAKSLQQESTDITREDHVAGTVDAMSPEQLQGQTLCPRSDLFSLGAIAYQLLCNARPLDKGDGGSLALAHKVIHEPHIPPQQACPELPEPLAALLDRLLAKQPGARPESAQQVYEALAFLHQHQAADTDSDEFSATVTALLRKPPSQRRKLYKRLGYTAALGALTVAGYFGWEYATRLEPQYIAVMPVEISGEVRGEDNAKALTATMVRQALMNSVSQLKASALVSFTPKEGQDFDAQLQALRDKGVTDALFARLECARVRCEIELQRIGPIDSQIRNQAGMTLLASKQRESSYSLTNIALSLFDKQYHGPANSAQMLSIADYQTYIAILSRTENKDIREEDLNTLRKLLNKNPENLNLYRLFTKLSWQTFTITNDRSYIFEGLTLLKNLGSNIDNKKIILELELVLRGFLNDEEKFDSTIKELQTEGFPSAHLLTQRARFSRNQGNYEQSLNYAKQANQLNPSAENHYLIALNQYHMGNYQSSIEQLTKIINKHPNHWTSYKTLGAIFLESGEYEKAKNIYKKIPDGFRTWHMYTNIGTAYFLEGNYTAALQSYDRSLKLSKNDPSTLGNIAEIYLITGKSEKALESFKRLQSITSKQDSPTSKRYYALSTAYLGEKSRSIELAHKLINKYPDDPNIKFTAAQIYLLADEYRSANYFVETLLKNGMGPKFFILPVFKKLCGLPETSKIVNEQLCN